MTNYTLRQSDIAKFMECRRSFYLEYVLGLQKRYPEGVRPPGTSDTGTLMHLGIEYHYDGNNVYGPDLFKLLEKKAVELAGGDLTDEWYSTIGMAQAMVHSYVNHVETEDIDLCMRVVDQEHEFSWNVPVVFSGGITVTIEGHADILVFDEMRDAFGIGDHKSVAGLKQLPRQNNFQLRTYALLWNKEDGTVPEFGFHNMVVRNKRTAAAKGPFELRAPITLGQEVLDYHEDQLMTVLHEIVEFLQVTEEDNVKSVPLHATPSMSSDCDWKCRGRDMCPKMDMPGYDWRDQIENNYDTHTNSAEDPSTDVTVPGNFNKNKENP